jgi:hypothetical protein
MLLKYIELLKIVTASAIGLPYDTHYAKNCCLISDNKKKHPLFYNFFFDSLKEIGCDG